MEPVFNAHKDIPVFVSVLLGNVFYQFEADVDQSGVVGFNDVTAFVDILLGQ